MPKAARPMTTLVVLVDHTGSAKMVIDQTKTFIGTPMFMAPEVLNMEEYSTAADVWSIGVHTSNKRRPFLVTVLLQQNGGTVMAG